MNHSHSGESASQGRSGAIGLATRFDQLFADDAFIELLSS